MLLNDLEIQKFVKKFNEKKRKVVETNEKFNTLKKELNIHLKEYGKKLRSLEHFDVFLESNVLKFRYLENTGVMMTVELMWKVNELTREDIEKYIEEFSVNDLEIEKDKLPLLNLVKSNTHQYFALYWPDTQSIVISDYVINQLDEEVVKSILRHEIIHHYLHINGKDPSDNSRGFVELVKKHDAYISQDAEALKAYNNLI